MSNATVHHRRRTLAGRVALATLATGWAAADAVGSPRAAAAEDLAAVATRSSARSVAAAPQTVGGEGAGPVHVAYGPAPSQFAELSRPAGAGPWPVVVLIHGGSWQQDVTLDMLRPLARDLQARGFAVWNVEYRRLGEAGGGWPGTFTDIARAIDRMASVRGIDQDRVAVVGHSAGGTLALWAAARSNLPAGTPGANPVVRVHGVVALAAVSDLETCAAAAMIQGSCQALLGGLPDVRHRRYGWASPRESLPMGVPELLVHGTQDDVIPVSFSRTFVHDAVAAGDPAELWEIPGNHFTPILLNTPTWTRVANRLAQFTA